MLLYRDLDTRRVKAVFAKLRAALEAGDWRSAEVKKLAPTPYWRAKLDYANRLLLRFARSGDETVCLLLEVIANPPTTNRAFCAALRSTRPRSSATRCSPTPTAIRC